MLSDPIPGQGLTAYSVAKPDFSEPVLYTNKRIFGTCLHLLSFADNHSWISVSFPVDMLHLSQDGDVCKSRNTVASHVEEMMDTFTKRLLLNDSAKMLDGPILAAVLSTSAPCPSNTEEVLQKLRA